jgi:hypothetical protein
VLGRDGELGPISPNEIDDLLAQMTARPEASTSSSVFPVGTFMPRLQETSGGRCGAFLFATYAVVLSIAEFATLRSAR